MTDDKITSEFNLCKNIISIEQHRRILLRLARFRVTDQSILFLLDFHMNDFDEFSKLSIQKLQHIVDVVKLF